VSLWNGLGFGVIIQSACGSPRSSFVGQQVDHISVLYEAILGCIQGVHQPANFCSVQHILAILELQQQIDGSMNTSLTNSDLVVELQPLVATGFVCGQWKCNRGGRMSLQRLVSVSIVVCEGALPGQLPRPLG